MRAALGCNERTRVLDTLLTLRLYPSPTIPTRVSLLVRTVPFHLGANSRTLRALVSRVLAVRTEGRAIIRRRYSKSFLLCFNSLVPAARAYPHPAATEIRRSNDVLRPHALWT